MTTTPKTYSRARTARAKARGVLSAAGIDPQEGIDFEIRHAGDGEYMPVLFTQDQAAYDHGLAYEGVSAVQAEQPIVINAGSLKITKKGEQAKAEAGYQPDEAMPLTTPESDGLEGLEDAAQEAEQTAQEQAGVMLATVDGNLGIVPKSRAKLEARQEANKLDKKVCGRDPISDEVLFTVEPHGGQDAKTAQVIAAAKREEGVTAAELRALTGWTKAPWRWLFTNPKGTGWADKYGLEFASVMEKDANNRRQARYFLRTPDQQQNGKAA